MQTAQGPKLSQSPKSVTAFPPRDWWLSAPDAAEGGAQLPNTLATGNGNTGTSSSAATHVGSNSSWRAQCLCSGAPMVAPSRQRESPRKHLTLDEEGSSQATPRTCSGCIFAPDSHAGTALATENHQQPEPPAQLQPQSQPSLVEGWSNPWAAPWWSQGDGHCHHLQTTSSCSPQSNAPGLVQKPQKKR